MPSGRTHDRITLICLPWVGILSLMVTFNLGLTLSLCGGFLFSGFMFGPDLDIVSKPFQRWGPFRFIWVPYQRVLSHRSWLSHGPIVGTVLRLLYLSAWIGLLLGLSQIFKPLISIWTLPQAVGQLWQQHPRSCLAVLAGLEMGAMSHSLSDMIGSGVKAAVKPFKKRSKRRSSPRRQR